MIFLTDYKCYDLLSDYINRDLSENEWEENVELYDKVINESEFYNRLGETENTYPQYLMEIESTLDLINSKMYSRSKTKNLIEMLAILTFNYLFTNHYKFSKDELIEELMGIYEEKNWDYNNSAEKLLIAFGDESFLIRGFDKIARLRSFDRDGEMLVKKEKIEDTLGDLFNYCMIYLVWYKKGSPIGM